MKGSHALALVALTLAGFVSSAVADDSAYNKGVDAWRAKNYAEAQSHLGQAYEAGRGVTGSMVLAYACHLCAAATAGKLSQSWRHDMNITVETTIAAPVALVWQTWTTPADIQQWNAASDDWHTTRSSVDLREGGAFSSRMEAKDGSMGFDFAGIYTRVVEHQLIECAFGDRSLRVEFLTGPDGVTVRETFGAEPTHSEEQQRAGWQAILDNFARHVRGKLGA